MSDEEVKSKDGKGLKVCFPDLNATPEEKATAIKVLDNYIARYEREQNENKTEPTVA